MRIGLDVRALQTSGGSATRGIGRYVVELVEGLDSKPSGLRLVLLALAGRPLPNAWHSRFEVVPVYGAVFHEMPKPWYMKLPKIRSSQALLGRLHGRAVASQRAGFEKAVNGAGLDVLHLPTAVDVGSYVAGDFDPPVVATFLDAIPLVHREAYYDTWGRFLRRYYDRQLLELGRAAKVLAISEASRQDALRYAHLDPAHVRVVYPTISPTYGIPADAADVRQRLKIPGPFVLFCSVPDPHKNPARAAAAFAAVRKDLPRGTQLVFVSPLEEPYESTLRRAARQCGLEDAYMITGRLSEEDLVALFQSASCLLSPSLIEGFGLPAAQALLSGTPPIVSNRGSQPEVVGDAGIVVDPYDIDDIGRALVRVMNDPSYRRELSAKGRERAKLFAPERQSGELRSVYREVAG